MIRILIPSLLLLVSLLTVIRAPTYHLWLLSIAITEYPWLPVAVSAALIPIVYRQDAAGIVATLMAVLAILFFLSPVVRVKNLAGRVENELTAAFGAAAGAVSGPPFAISRMFNKQPAIPFSEYVYAENLSLDFYKAARTGLRPCVIVVHGGSWAGGNSRQMPELNSVLANAGYHVAAINYRLAPACKSPGQVEDVRNAIRYLKNNAAHLGIDSNRLILLGRSAGAQITLAASYTLHEKAIIGTISYYGPADMVWGYSLAANPLVFDSRKVMVDYLGGTYEEVPQNYFNSSPIEFASPQSPPTLLIHGPLDPLVAYDHSVRLNRKLNELQVPHYFLDLPCGTHGCDYTLNGPSGQVATYTVLSFLNRIAGKK